MTSGRPLIGITTRLEHGTNRFYLARSYSEAVEAAGGVPVHVPLIPRPGYVSALVGELDGFLLPGSDSDVDPVRYKREPHPDLGSVCAERDEIDLGLLREIELGAIPVLAICFGMQVLNVSRGGTLIQDIRSQKPEAIQHQQGQPRERRSHRVTLLPESLLGGLASGPFAMVNSHHHQAIEVLGDSLVATAWTADGLVEAVEDPRRDRFVVGVQWHPEVDWEHDEIARALFSRFVDASLRYREGRRRLPGEAARIGNCEDGWAETTNQ